MGVDFLFSSTVSVTSCDNSFAVKSPVHVLIVGDGVVFVHDASPAI